MKNNINKKVGATLLAAAIMAGTAVIPMSNAAVEAAAKEANKPSIQYRTQVQDYGWEQHWSGKEWRADGETAGTVGQGKRMEAVNIRLINCEGVSLDVVAHVQDYGDIEYKNITESTMIGTQKEEKRIEAIKITANGLKEKGYKIVYRTQVQDYGWEQHWSGKEWREEGEWSGTRGESKRLETIEIKVVPINESAVVAKYVDTLESYDIVMAHKLDEDSDDYKAMEAKISTAIANMRKAATNVEAKAIYDAIVEEIKTVEPKVETKAPIVVAEAQTARDEAMDKIREYQETLATITELETGAAANLNIRIATAIVDVNNAKTANKIEKVVDALDGIVDGYEVEFAKAKAINELNEYAPYSATQGVKDYVADAVKNIKETDKTVAAVESRMSTALPGVRALIAKQELLNDKFDVYVKNASKYAAPLDGYIVREANSRRNNVNNNKNVSQLEAEFNAFVAYLKKQEGLENIDTDLAKEINNVINENTVREAINAKIEYLEAYAKNVEVRVNSDEWRVVGVDVNNTSLPANYPVDGKTTFKSPYSKDTENTKKAQKLAEEYIKEFVKKLNEAETLEKVNEIMEKDTTVTPNTPKSVFVQLNDKIKTEIDREVAYKEVNKVLNEYAALVPTLELTNLEDVEKYIENTRKDIENAKTAEEINTAKDRFVAYMNELKLNDELAKEEASQQKADAIRTLQKYTKSGNLSKVVEIAKEAIENINKGTYVLADGTTDTTATAVTTCNNAMRKILEEIKLDAFTQINEYNTRYSTSTEVTTIANAAIAKIVVINGNSADTETCETYISDVKIELSKALREITAKVPSIEDENRTKFENKREELTDLLQEYIDMAEDIGDTTVKELAENAQYLISKMPYTSKARPSDLTASMKNFTDELNTKAKTNERSKALENLMEATRLSKKLYTAQKAQLQAYIDEAVNTIANIPVSDTSKKADDIAKAVSKVKAIQDAYIEVTAVGGDTLDTKSTALYNTQKEKITALENKSKQQENTAEGFAVKEAIAKAIDEIDDIKLVINENGTTATAGTLEWDSANSKYVYTAKYTKDIATIVGDLLK